MQNQDQIPQEGISETSDTVEERFTRFKDAPWFSETGDKRVVVVGGAGGIGSWLSLMLSRLGVAVICYDFDTVDGVNLGGQLYGGEHIGQAKVEALQSVVNSFSDSIFDGVNARYGADSIVESCTFSAFDNIEARRVMFHRWESYIDGPDYKGQLRDAIFIDGRLTMEQLQIFSITGDNGAARSDYRTCHLPDDSTIPDAPCTLKQTSHSAAMIASHMVATFTNHLTNVAVGEQERFVPYKWEFFIPLGLLTEKSIEAHANAT
jgi:ThiF family